LPGTGSLEARSKHLYNEAMKGIQHVAFDADDTLWHNETIFREAQDRFTDLLSHYHSAEWIARRLNETEKKNLEYFGYGVKGFTLSMIETAIELTEGRITGAEIQHLIDVARGMLEKPVELLADVHPTLERVSRKFALMVITKGDLFDQESKLARSGIGDFFDLVEIVSEKTPATYRRILQARSIEPSTFLMVGNSLKSDILPVLEAGGRAVHIPYPTTWAHEEVSSDQLVGKPFAVVGGMGELVEMLEA